MAAFCGPTCCLHGGMESHGVRQPLESALAIQVEALVNLQVLMQQCVSGQQLLRSPHTASRDCWRSSSVVGARKCPGRLFFFSRVSGACVRVGVPAWICCVAE